MRGRREGLLSHFWSKTVASRLRVLYGILLFLSARYDRFTCPFTLRLSSDNKINKYHWFPTTLAEVDTNPSKRFTHRIFVKDPQHNNHGIWSINETTSSLQTIEYLLSYKQDDGIHEFQFRGED
jgi:hypothetical protein